MQECILYEDCMNCAHWRVSSVTALGVQNFII